MNNYQHPKYYLVFLLLALFLISESSAQYNPWQSVLSQQSSAVIINDSGHVFVGGNNGLYLSEDNGDTWSHLHQESVSNIALNSQGHIFTGSQGSGIYRSTDDGNNWRQINYGLPSLIVEEIAINSSDSIFVAVGGYEDYIYISSDNGDNWTQTTHPYLIITGLGISLQDDIFTACRGDIYRSIDNGENWTLRHHLSLQFFAFTFPSNQNIFVGGDRWILRSTDNGNTFERIRISAECWGMADNKNIGIYKDDLYFSGDIGVYRSIDNGNSWVQFNNGLFWSINAWSVAVAPNNNIFLARNDGLFRSDGNFWSKPNPPGNIQTILEINDVTLTWNNPLTDFWGDSITIDSTFVYRNTIKVGTVIGNDSTFVDSNLIPGNYIYSLQACYSGYTSDSTMADPIIIWGQTTIYNRAELNKNIPDNDPQGISDSVLCSLTNTVMNVVVHINELNHTWNEDLDIYLTGPNGSQIELSTDNGGNGDNYINCVFDDTAYSSITTATAPMTGLWRPEQSLSTYNDNPANGYWILKIIDDTYGESGTLQSWTLELITNPFTEVYGETTNQIPTGFFLSQNYPNPFNPVTHIRFGLPKASDVILEIYNVLGQRIITLVDTHKPAGYHEVILDATHLASVIYLYKIQSGKFNKVKKMILMK